MNYTERDTYGMYTGMHKPQLGARVGPGPELMGAETLVGNDVYSPQDENLGNIKRLYRNLPSKIIQLNAHR